MTEVTVHGGVSAGFEPVREAFAAAFQDRPAMGAAVAVRHRGVAVVDLWAGVSDAETGAPWERDTANVIFSCTKGVVSLLLAQLVQEGRIAYDDPVTDVWPEYGAAGKAGSTVAHLVSHRAGLSALREPMTWSEVLDWSRATARLAEAEPLWEPGTGWAYHAITHGWLAGEVIRRVAGESVGARLQRAISSRVGGATWIGLPSASRPPLARMWAGPTQRSLAETTLAAQTPGIPDWPSLALTLGGALPLDLVGDAAHPGFNDPAILTAEVPGAGGVSTARSLAAIWSAAVVPTDGVLLLDDAVLDTAVAVQSEGAPVFDVPGPWPRWGMGLQLDSEARRYLGPTSFGHDGAGGQVAFADREAEIGFAFTTNQMEAIDDRRATSVIDALRACL